MAFTPHTAMVLAAGLGMRMRPLTLEKPKPLLVVGGETMLDQVLDRLAEAGTAKAVINLHYKGEMIEQHVQGRAKPQIVFSDETAKLLDTGGGIRHAAAKLGDDPVFVVNSDLPWRDGTVPALQRLANAFDPARMDALLLLMLLEKARGFAGAKGDFFMKDEGGGLGPLYRHGHEPPRPYVFISAQIIRPSLFTAINEDVFSTNRIWDALEEKGRLFGLIHDASCYHVGTPPDLEEANRLLKEGAGW
jgi:MurNAc alpha-1-phosphate uridylyltransferase